MKVTEPVGVGPVPLTVTVSLAELVPELAVVTTVGVSSDGVVKWKQANQWLNPFPSGVWNV